MFDDLSDLSDSPASYLAVLALVALDAVFPVAPSETVLVTGGVLIERGDLSAPLFLLAAASGAVLGDLPLPTPLAAQPVADRHRGRNLASVLLRAPNRAPIPGHMRGEISLSHAGTRIGHADGKRFHQNGTPEPLRSK